MKTVLVLSVLFFHGTLGDLVVQTENGNVQGTTIDTPSGQTFYAWKGIPYGKPPLGALRFLPPVKAEPWEGILDGSQDSPACIFFGVFPGDPAPINGNSEDCLYVNVYSPVPAGSNSTVNATRSVLFWIYGGGFFSGFSDFGFYDPTPFLEDDVVVVSLNYRLGALGFLSTEDEVVLGNAGLKDQLLALIWTRDNIAAFGGNPNDITIFGESAGGISVGYHIVSPLSRGLFKGAILQSGSAISSLLQANARGFALYMASTINSSITITSTSAEIRDVLQGAPVYVLQNLTSGMVSPVIEVQSNLSFLTQPLYETLEAGEIARVPILIGCNSEEQIGYGNDTSMYLQIASMYDSYPQMLVPSDLKLNENASAEAIGKEIYQQYVGDNGSFVNNLATYFEYASDNFMVRNSNQHAILQSKFTPVYQYIFSYYGTLSKGNLIVPGAGKVAHAQELGYLFNISTKVIETDEDYLTRKRFVKLWTNFAKFSNPTPDDDSAELLQNVKWEPITEDNVQYLDIGEDLQVKPSQKHEKTIFWQHIWDTYSYRPYNTF